MKAQRIVSNTKGTRFALVRDQDGSFSVWRECQNYAAHVRGGIAKTWRYSDRKMTLEAAEAMLARKEKGKV
jgi:hypothetical protein